VSVRGAISDQSFGVAQAGPFSVQMCGEKGGGRTEHDSMRMHVCILHTRICCICIYVH